MEENTKPAKPELTEIATARDGRDITRGYVDYLPLLPTQDRLLLLKGANLMVYEDVLRDDQVKTCVEQRVRAVISRPWEVRAGGEKLIDKKAAQFLDEQLKRIRWDSITEKMLYGVFYGYAVAEALFSVQDGMIVLDVEREGIKVRNRRRFGFDPKMQLKMKTMQQPLGEYLPEKKFWHFAAGADNDDEPYGLGLAHWLYWPVFFKRNGVKFWLTFLEKFGTPTAVGKYQPGTPINDQNKLLAALQSIQTDSAIIFPEGMTAELLEATRGGTADYTDLYERMDTAIGRVTLGQTASIVGSPGKLGNEQLQAEVRMDIVKADADLVCMSFNATIARWLTEWNFPGAAYPSVWRTIEQPEDLNTRAERDTKITGMGFKPTAKYIHDTYGGEWVAASQSPPAADTQAQPGPSFAENNEHLFADQVALDAAIEAIAPGLLQGQAVESLKPVLKMIAESADYAEVHEKLAGIFPAMNTQQLEDTLARAMFVAEVYGRVTGSDNG